jgi:ligand-binding SRPBCC domain-containing protein
MHSHLEFEQWVPFPLGRVFAFFSNPENLPRLMPVSTGTQIIKLNRMPPPTPLAGASDNQAAGVGSTIVTSFRVLPALPMRAQWVARITEFEWNHHFADVQDIGPFKSWRHRHEFRAETRDGVPGTIVSDLIDYEIGVGFLDPIVDDLFIRRQMKSIFARRQQTLLKLMA